MTSRSKHHDDESTDEHKPKSAADADPKAASKADKPTDIEAELTHAADGLLYLSEGEAPFEPVFKPGVGSAAMTPEETLKALGVAADGPVEVRTLDRFFAGALEDSDPADDTIQSLRPRFQALKDLLLTLTDAKAICTGEVDKRCYLVGRTSTGDLAGLVTTATET